MAKYPSKKPPKPVKPELKKFRQISEEFLQRKEMESRNFARWELNFLWTKYRQIKVSELQALDIKNLTVSEAIVVNALKDILAYRDNAELNKLYDRILGKPKENRDEKIIDDVEFSIGILEKPIGKQPEADET